jgi:hypothetical protein
MLVAIGHCSFLLGLVVLLLSVVVRGAASLAPVHGDELGAVGGLAGVLEVEVRAELDDVVQLPASEDARQADEVLVAGQVEDGDRFAGHLGASSVRFRGPVGGKRGPAARETGQRLREVLLQAGHGALDALAPAVGGEPQALADLTTRLVQDQHRDEQLRVFADHGLEPRAQHRDVLVEREGVRPSAEPCWVSAQRLSEALSNQLAMPSSSSASNEADVSS